MSLLVAEGLRKHFGPHQVLRGVDLEVAEGTVTCLIGASGSGKSTLLRCLNLLETVDDGSVHFEGREITDPRVDADAVRRRIAMVFQAYNLFPHLSVLDNITLSPRRVGGVRRGEAEQRARDLLERFGLVDKAAAHPDGLSGGQQQRVALIRAIAMRPRVLLLDEVTSALDPMLVGEVLAVVRELQGEGMTMVLATHEMAFAREVADQVVFMRDGVVHEQGTAAEVLGSPHRPETRAFLGRTLV